MTQHQPDADRFSDEAAGWDDQPGHAERTLAVAALLRATLPLRPDLELLEIGGGTGSLSRELADVIGRAVVTDVAPGMVEVARERLTDPRFEGWEARRYDIERDELLDERFDVVVGVLTLHHMGDVAAVIGRCAQLLRPGGHLALVDLDHDAEGAFHAGVEYFDGHDGFTRQSARSWLQSAGLVEIEVRDAGAITKEVDGGERDFPMFLATGRRP